MIEDTELREEFAGIIQRNTPQELDEELEALYEANDWRAVHDCLDSYVESLDGHLAAQFIVALATARIASSYEQDLEDADVSCQDAMTALESARISIEASSADLSDLQLAEILASQRVSEIWEQNIEEHERDRTDHPEVPDELFQDGILRHGPRRLAAQLGLRASGGDYGTIFTMLDHYQSRNPAEEAGTFLAAAWTVVAESAWNVALGRWTASSEADALKDAQDIVLQARQAYASIEDFELERYIQQRLTNPELAVAYNNPLASSPVAEARTVAPAEAPLPSEEVAMQWGGDSRPASSAKADSWEETARSGGGPFGFVKKLFGG